MKRILVFGLLALMVSQSLAFFGPPPDAPRGRDKMFERITRELKLTEEQKAQIKAEMEKDRKDMEKNQAEVKKLAEEMKAELEKDAPDRARIHDLIKKLADKRAEMEIRRMDNLLAMRKLLTPEQREKFKEMARPKQKSGRRGWKR